MPTEREKMIAGDLYLASDPDLVASRAKCRVALRLYNASIEGDEREAMLKELLGGMGSGVWIEPPFYCDYGTYITLGENTYFNFNCVVLDCAPVRIGSDVLIGPGVQFNAATHPVLASERATGFELAHPITIGDNVWIGGGAIIGPGIMIGDNTTIGAGSIVTRDIPANVVAVGNPCRVMRHL